jgi:hypothetical protein
MPGDPHLPSKHVDLLLSRLARRPCSLFPLRLPLLPCGACVIQRLHNLPRDLVNAMRITQVPQGRTFDVIKQYRGDGVVTISIHAEHLVISLQQQGTLRG